MAKVRRPSPPAEAVEPGESVFLPAPGLKTWAIDTFLDSGSRLYNAAHDHLLMADLGFLWTNHANERQGNAVVGQAQMVRPHPALGKWDKERQLYQLRQWFGCEPDFLITIYAPYANEADNWSFCALVEHELLHCSIKGFTSKGNPLWCLKGHDVEEHVAIVERYGPGAAAGKTMQLVEAAKKRPTVGKADLAWACGTCLKAAA